MKWFKHVSKSRFDVKLSRVIRKHGLRGYGLYFAVLETIAFDLEPEKPVPELEQTAKDIAEFFGEDTIKIEDIMRDCITEGLLNINPENSRIMCLKMLAHLDNTMSQNPQIRAILDNFKSLEVAESSLKQKRLDELKSDKTKGEGEAPDGAVAPSLKKEQVLEIWNTSVRPPIPTIREITEDRWRKYKLRLDEGMDIKEIVKLILESEFLCGKNKRQWNATFDWVISNPGNWKKILEGNYKNKKGSAGAVSAKSGSNTDAAIEGNKKKMADLVKKYDGKVPEGI